MIRYFHIHTLEFVIEKYSEKHRPLYIDYKKALHKISYKSIWNTLKEQGVKNIQVLQSIYKNNRGVVKLEKTSPSFPIKRGFRQGDPTSPRLFWSQQ